MRPIFIINQDKANKILEKQKKLEAKETRKRYENSFKTINHEIKKASKKGRHSIYVDCSEMPKDSMTNIISFWAEKGFTIQQRDNDKFGFRIIWG